MTELERQAEIIGTLVATAVALGVCLLMYLGDHSTGVAALFGAAIAVEIKCRAIRGHAR